MTRSIMPKVTIRNKISNSYSYRIKNSYTSNNYKQYRRDAIALLSQVLCKFWEPDDQNPPIITERILLSHVFLYLLAILSYLCLPRSLLSYTSHCVYAFISLEFWSCKNCSFKSCFSYFFASPSHILHFVSKAICGRSIVV